MFSCKYWWETFTEHTKPVVTAFEISCLTGLHICTYFYHFFRTRLIEKETIQTIWITIKRKNIVENKTPKIDRILIIILSQFYFIIHMY